MGVEKGEKPASIIQKGIYDRLVCIKPSKAKNFYIRAIKRLAAERNRYDWDRVYELWKSDYDKLFQEELHIPTQDLAKKSLIMEIEHGYRK